MSIQVRAAAVDDAPIIERIARETWADTYTGLIPENVQTRFLDRAYAPESLREAIRRPESWFFVAERDGEVIGFAEYAPRSEEKVDLLRMYVLPAEQRAGAGAALLKAGLDAIRDADGEYTTVIAGVEVGNDKAIRFCEKHGFKHATTTKFAHADVNTHVYERKL